MEPRVSSKSPGDGMYQCTDKALLRKMHTLLTSLTPTIFAGGPMKFVMEDTFDSIASR